MTVPDIDANPERTDDPLVLSADDLAASPDCYDAAAIALAANMPAAADPASAIDIRVSLPVDVAVALKRRTNGALDAAETLALIAQLYSDAPLERSPKVLTSDHYARICSTLGFSPQSLEEMVSAIEGLVAISFGGLRVKFTAEEVELINARNASELAPKEYAAQIHREMFEAWRDGRI